MLSGAGPRTPRTAFLGFSLTPVKRFFILKCAHPHHTSFSLPTAHLYPHPDPLEASSLRGSSFLLIEIHSLIGSIKNFHAISPQIHVSFRAPRTSNYVACWEETMQPESVLPPYTPQERSREIAMRSKALCCRARKACTRSRFLRKNSQAMLLIVSVIQACVALIEEAWGRISTHAGAPPHGSTP